MLRGCFESFFELPTLSGLFLCCRRAQQEKGSSIMAYPVVTWGYHAFVSSPSFCLHVVIVCKTLLFFLMFVYCVIPLRKVCFLHSLL
jgi:hypothetical protein